MIQKRYVLMKIALCDDNSGQLRILTDAVKNCKHWLDSDVKIKQFTSGAELLESVRNGALYDYIFLDIEMPELSGFDTYAELQSLYECPIIFVSTHIEQLPEVFALKPYGFLAKPYNQDTFDRTVKSVIEQISNKQFYHYTNDGKSDIINCNYILYFIIKDYVLKMYLIDGSSVILPRKRLDEVESEVRDFGFFRCNRSVLVNLYHCSGRKDSCLIMNKADATIEISRRKLKEFDKQLILYRMEAVNAF